jgi:hypothetical protein
MEQKHKNEPQLIEQRPAAIAANLMLNDVLLRKVYRAYCCGKKRHQNQLDFISNGYDGTGVFCKTGRGCKKNII